MYDDVFINKNNLYWRPGASLWLEKIRRR